MTKIYEHVVQYYETDKMGITHHSNYIRWMEEARVDFLNKIGWGFDKLEAKGIVSPVVAVECQYKASTTFPEVIRITVSIEEFKGVKLRLKYSMLDSEERIVCIGKSEHCFLGVDGKPVRLNKELPDFYKVITELAET